MNCNTISSYIIDYIDNKLDKNTIVAIARHIEKCPDCKLEYEQTKKMLSDISETPLKQPGNELLINFNEILNKEKSKQQDVNTKTFKLKSNKILWQIAASILLVISGYLLGYNTKMTSVKDKQVAEMQTDIREMKQQMYAINMLQNESASRRIKAVNYTEELQNPSNETIKALINTLDTDPSSNVRLAAVYSLSRFKNNSIVKEAFINTLNKQEDPMVQVIIINMLVEMEEVRAVDKLKELLKNTDLNEEVRTQAELGVKVLL